MTVNALLGRRQRRCMISSSRTTFWQQNKSLALLAVLLLASQKNSIHLMNDAYISETTTDVKLEKMELRISHHFSTLSEYPIISRCVKTREKKLQKQCSKGCSIVFMDLIDYIACGNRTHLFYFFFFSPLGPFFFFRILITTELGVTMVTQV